MSGLNLNPAHLIMVHEILRAYAPDTVVWAYGSRVNGSCHEASDLDLVLRNVRDESLPVSCIARLREAFRESNLPIVVDVLDWAGLPESFRQEILATHIELPAPPA